MIKLSKYSIRKRKILGIKRTRKSRHKEEKATHRERRASIM